MSTARRIIERVRDNLRTISGPPYHCSVQAVTLGDPGPGCVDGPLPALWLTGWAIDSQDDDQLGAYRRIITLQVLGVVVPTEVGDDSPDAPGERALVATDLLDDIATCLERDRTCGGSVVRMIVVGQAIDGAALDIPAAGVCEAVVTLEYIAPSEVGF